MPSKGRHGFSISASTCPMPALRAYVMGYRGADPIEPPDDDELSRMADLLSASITAGALGLGSSRTEAHRTRVERRSEPCVRDAVRWWRWPRRCGAPVPFSR